MKIFFSSLWGYNFFWLTSVTGTSAIQYKYDGNGNVIADPGKNIALIIYDTDNLPVTVYKNDGSQIQYYYDVNGNKVKKTTKQSSELQCEPTFFLIKK